MFFLYNIVISIYFLMIQLFSLKNKKAKLWIEGRRDIFKKIDQKLDKNKLYVWFHFASLGEFEQGRPVLEHFRSEYPKEPILITFFSPSGYEIRKNYDLADHIFYLPLDTSANAKKFIELIKPKFAVFTKYEYWYHYFKTLHRNQIPLYVISGIFRDNQPFFKWYGSLHREILSYVSHFFVQNTESADLLKSIKLSNVSISGDTRFDRVAENALKPKRLAEIERFCDGFNVIVAGSTWIKDEEYISEVIESFPNWKLIIAPHETNIEHILNVKALFKEKSILYSEYIKNSNAPIDVQTLIIDNIGMLSSLYQYAQIAYIGGGFGNGIHNTLEAAAFGVPVIFGPKYYKFQEAKDLLAVKAAFTIMNAQDLKDCIRKLVLTENREIAGEKAKHYVENHTGATAMILKHISSAINF